MPIIACHHCKSRFKVPIDTVGESIECPKCRSEFKAVALRTGARKDHGTPPIVYAAVGVGAVLVVGLVAMMTGGDDAEPVAKAEPTVEAAPEIEAPAEDRSTGGPKEALILRARDILEAVRIGDEPLLPTWIDYPRMHEERRRAGEVTDAWTTLSEEQKYAAREECLEGLAGDEVNAEFLRHAAVESAEVVEMGQGKGAVALHLKNPLTDTTQKVTMRFSTSAGTWKLAAIERGEIEGGPEGPPVAENDGPVAAPTAVGALDPEGDVGEVALVEGTSPSTKSTIERAMKSLLDLSSTVEASRARTDLVEAGKPSIPHLLNALAPLDLKNPEDLLLGVRISNTLIDLTGRDYPILPGMNEGSMMGEFASDNDANRRRWFGWWRDNQDTYTGPPEIGFDDEDD